MASIKKFRSLVLAGALIFGASACDQDTSLSGSNQISGDCITGQAQLVVYDTFIQSVCGCQESPEISNPPNGITCTVPVGTSIWFWYLSTTLLHQIQSTATPTFQTSSLSDPNSSNPVRTHVVTLSTTGSYEFDDVYNRAINGTIVVQ